MTAQKLDQPRKWWDRLFAPSFSFWNLDVLPAI